MKLYNTMTRRKEEFTATDIVRMYVCGVTPYDTTHAGHAFTYVFFDVLARYLRHLGHGVRYVQNVTDIDDDILKRSREVGTTWDALGREQTALYVQDMADLNVIAPDVFPLATQETRGMIALIQTLLAGGHAYEVEGSVYFSVASDPEFGTLAGLAGYEEMLEIANERGNFPDDPKKRDPLDFVLWQAGQPGEPTWPSPWGAGRPGWHIECSSMAMRYLGPTVDIHGGGGDLVFPHHACEIAQSENATGIRPFVRFWVHTAMVEYHGQKMSKSLGNLVFVREVLKGHSADALRLYLLQHHYRTAWDYEDDGPTRAEVLVERLRAVATGPTASGDHCILASHHQRFLDALADDMDTPRAIEALMALAAAIDNAHARGQDTAAARELVRELGGVLGLRLGGDTRMAEAGAG
ncbi:MAG: cysteine--tRNA ligase [Chloroflexota bacterium]